MARRKAAAQVAASEDTPLESETVIETNEADQNPATPIIQQVADSTQLPPDAAEFDPEKLERQSHAQREQARRADPFPSHSYHFPDGYKITYQESDSRHTVEIQFGDGSRVDQPQNFEAIKPFLKENGMRWNGTNAWVTELRQPPKFRREPFAEKEDRIAENANIRAHVENVVLPTVLSLEEEKRGEVEVTDETRQRINKVASGQGR